MEHFLNLSYILASALFIFGIKMLGSADTARRGNRLSALGMLVAVVATLVQGGMHYSWILVGVVVGASIGAVAARRVPMTGMPEMVALFNGFGGFASLLVGWAEFARRGGFAGTDYPLFTGVAVVFAVLVGGVTFTGSLVAYLKLSGRMGGTPALFRGQRAVNALVFAALAAFGIVFAATQAPWALWLVIALALVLGVLAVIPIGGGDMPVVIAFLNSFSGIAASAAGFVLLNNVLIVAGSLVGASGMILTIIMCKAMNRSLANVLFGGFGAAQGRQDQVEGEMKAITPEDAYYVLESAESVVFVPGYGMAVAQAQHAVKELAGLLEDNGAEVRYAIHPVAGRMPGHMNVLLAEADVPYEQLCEMEEVNAVMDTVDVAVVIGANDVVNPAASEDESSPIYGMPIVEAHRARTVFALKRGQGPGFSGLVNTLFFRENTRMIYGDAKETMHKLAAQFKE